MSQARKDFPKISIVTPSFNQGQFIENTILSVLEQNYPNLEYIIIDGGSTDNSVEIIKKYKKYLSYWVSEKDRGQYHAINKGFEKSHGEIMAWLNSDDMYCKWAFDTCADIFSQCTEIEWITSLYPLIWDVKGNAAHCAVRLGYSAESFFEGRHTDIHPDTMLGYIQQESTFWKRSLWERAGCHISERYSLAGDYELWSRLFRHAILYGVNTPLSGFRVHANQKSKQIEQYRAECLEIVKNVMVHQKSGFLMNIFTKVRSNPIGARACQKLYNVHSLIAHVHEDITKWCVISENKIL
jgi:glycosyltransferase involved in cell wall biosynthesis